MIVDTNKTEFSSDVELLSEDHVNWLQSVISLQADAAYRLHNFKHSFSSKHLKSENNCSGDEPENYNEPFRQDISGNSSNNQSIVPKSRVSNLKRRQSDPGFEADIKRTKLQGDLDNGTEFKTDLLASSKSKSHSSIPSLSLSEVISTELFHNEKKKAQNTNQNIIEKDIDNQNKNILSKDCKSVKKLNGR